MDDVTFRVLDVETSGLEPPEAEIIETGWTDVVYSPDTKSVRIGETHAALWRPERGIPVETRAVHHIRPDMVADELVFMDEHAKLWVDTDYGYGSPTFLVAHNAKFEQLWLRQDITGDTRWVDTYKCAIRIWDDAPGHSNQLLRYWLDLPVDDALATPPHRAGPDSHVTAHILAKMLETERVRDLVAWTIAPRYYATCPLPKHKGKPWSEIPHDYLVWITTKATEIDGDLKANAQAELDFRQANRT